VAKNVIISYVQSATARVKGNVYSSAFHFVVNAASIITKIDGVIAKRRLAVEDVIALK